MEKINKQIGEAIRMIRAQKGISQTDLAKKCDVSHPTIINLENGTGSVSSGTVEKALNALGLTVKRVLELTGG